jgi:hypothetical protein
MLKKGFYDLVTGISFVLVVALSILISGMTSSRIIEGVGEGAIGGLLVLQLIIGAIIFIYWLFILILAINLYEKGSLILAEVVITAILIPFVPLTYLLILRKPLKEYHEENPVKKKKSTIGNVPGTP